MPFYVRRARESDLPSAAEAHNEAFRQTSKIYKAMYPNGNTPVVQASILKHYTETFHNPIVTCYVVVDTVADPTAASDDSTAGEKVVSWICWKTYTTQQPASEWDVDPQAKAAAKVQPDSDAAASEENSSGDINTPFLTHFFSSLATLSRTYIRGKPRLHIDILITHPSYFRQGSGKLLLDVAAEHAKELRLPMVLESSPLARGFYKREGFGEVEGAVVSTDLEPWGGEGVNRNVLMERPWDT